MLLAFDTATPQVTVALYDETDVVAELVSDRPMKHGEQLAPLIDRVLAGASAERLDITAVAVGAGPGPFTGLRVGLVTARTLGYALDIPVYAVCTLDVLAVEAVDTGAVSGPFAVATDARRKEVYLATYDETGARMTGPVVDKPAALATDGPVVGEGALLYPEWFPTAVGPSRPSAGWLARTVAEERAELLDPEPLYLRRPDAVANAAAPATAPSAAASAG
jgi:tRNA threonylcarbamoyl adenosine modification protein YeaZ